LIACLGHADANGARHWAFLGDLVGYGADPAAVLDIVMAHAAGGAAVVLGNHDESALGRASQRMNAIAEGAMAWTRERLRPDHLAFLAGLPLTVREGQRLYVHASAAEPDRWTYVTDPRLAGRCMDAAQATHVFAGHVHDPQLYYQGADARPQAFTPTPGVAVPLPAHRRWLAVAGSCGQPRDGNAAASYALFDTSRHELTFHRIDYDHRKAAGKVRSRGLPERLALRLEQAR
jgi:hypothetical protein